MSVKAQYLGELEHNNAKMLAFKLTFAGTYGVQGVGDLLNLAPVEADNAGGVTDPNLAYNLILQQPPKIVGPLNANVGAYVVGVTRNANPTLKNFGLRVYALDGTGELTSNAAYPASVLAGDVTLLVGVPLQ